MTFQLTNALLRKYSLHYLAMFAARNLQASLVSQSFYSQHQTTLRNSLHSLNKKLSFVMRSKDIRNKNMSDTDIKNCLQYEIEKINPNYISTIAI